MSDLARCAAEVCDALEAAVAALKAAADPLARAPPRQQVALAAEVLKSEAAKLGFMFSQGQPPSGAAAESLLFALRDAAAALCALLSAAAAPGGPTLRKALHQCGEIVATACTKLVKAATGRGPRAALPRLAGICMERCDAAAKAPLDDKTAIGRAIALVARQVADAAAELASAVDEAEMEAVAEGPAGEGGGAEVAGDGAAVDPAAGAVVRSVQSMAEAALRVLHDTMRALLEPQQAPGAGGDGGSGGSGGVEAWESVMFHVRALAGAVDEVAAGAYPPHDCEELARAAEAVVLGCECIVGEVLELCAAGGAPRAALASAQEEVHAAEAQLQRCL